MTRLKVRSAIGRVRSRRMPSRRSSRSRRRRWSPPRTPAEPRQIRQEPPRGHIGRHHAERGHPALGIDELEGDRAREGHWALPANAGADPLGRGDLERQVDEIGRPAPLEHAPQGRKGGEDPGEPQAAQRDQPDEADQHPRHVRQGGAQAEVRARGHEHGVVRPRRDRGGEGEQAERREQLGGVGGGHLRRPCVGRRSVSPLRGGRGLAGLGVTLSLALHSRARACRLDDGPGATGGYGSFAVEHRSRVARESRHLNRTGRPLGASALPKE